jgi:hypothetical protein
MRRSLLVCLFALAACNPSHRDIAGPYTGTTYRFVVDQMQLPLQRSDYADDLNHDGRVDNELGTIAGGLGSDLTAATDDMLGSGVLAPVVEITTDDPTLRNDPTVGVRFIGRDGEPADQMGASLVDGVLKTNQTWETHAPASATIHLPLYEHADPLTLPAIGLEAALVADGSGFSGTLDGAFPATSDMAPAWTGMAQMVAANPQEFPFLLQILDTNRDTVISYDEFAGNDVMQAQMAPDVQLTDGHGGWDPSRENKAKDSLAFGLWIHLTPCPSGRCHEPPVNTCQDRVRDGDETDVDCGGSCKLACAGGAHCSVAADCQSRQCDAGVCAPPTCSDGVQDGGETGVDCGYNCAPCPPSG